MENNEIKGFKEVSVRRGKVIVYTFFTFVIIVSVIVFWSLYSCQSSKKQPNKNVVGHPSSIKADFDVPIVYGLEDDSLVIRPRNHSEDYASLEWSLIGEGRQILKIDTNPVFVVDTPGIYALSLAAYSYKTKRLIDTAKSLDTVIKTNGWYSYKDVVIKVIDNRLQLRLKIDSSFYFPTDKCEIRFKSGNFETNRTLFYGFNDFRLPRFWNDIKTEVIVIVCHFDPREEIWRQKTFVQELVIKDDLILNITPKKDHKKTSHKS
jgi:hypothetical protein